ncbi:MAG: DegT/DnrJ/EryC1/StrS family aminotransferase [Planctomycetes bacterium]|nr:DegT/DnrJ/EryC1/StrS family aminotransferase [Planctomycetota bacterium]
MTEGRSSDQPATEPIPFIDLKAQFQTIREEVLESVERVFENQAFILGDEVSEFEYDLAQYCDSREAIGCSSGSDALLLALLGLEIGPGDEVITSPFTFFATAGSITHCGATPVFVDIEPGTFNINADAIEAAISPRTKAIMPVHLFGQCAEMEPIWRIATRHGIPIVEDAAQAIGAEYHGRRAGVLGRVGCFSFFPTKNLGAAGDAGAITTDDPELAARLRRMRVHGDVGGYQHAEVGFNSRIDAIQAAVLKAKLAHLDSWSDARAENAALYRELITARGLESSIGLPVESGDGRHIYNQFSVRVLNGRRDEVMNELRARGIGCTIYYPRSLHLQDCFVKLGYREGDLRESERAAAEVLALPIYAELPESHQVRLVDTLAEILQAADPSTVSFPFDMPDRKAA